MEASCLAVLYGATAGGMDTPAGVPFNPLTISLLEQLTGTTITFAQWTLTGVILMLATVPMYYLVLLFMAPPEVKTIDDGAAYFGPFLPGGLALELRFHRVRVDPALLEPAHHRRHPVAAFANRQVVGD